MTLPAARYSSAFMRGAPKVCSRWVTGAWALVLALACLCAGSRVAAQAITAPFEVGQVQAPVSISEYTSILPDPTGRLTLDDVASPLHAARFAPYQSVSPSFSLATATLWTRFMLRNSGQQPAALVLKLDLPMAGHVDLYSPASGANTPAIRLASGASVPYAERPLPGRAFSFPLQLAPGAEQTYYLRITTDFSQRLPLTLSPAAAWTARLAQEDFAWALVVSLVLLLALYNLLVFAVTRERDHLLLAVVGAIGVLEIAVIDDYTSRWLGEFMRYSPHILTTCVALSTAAYVVLVISFLRLRQRVRWAWRILLGVLAVAILAGLIGLTWSPRLSFLLLLAAAPVMLVVTLVATIIGIRQGYRPAIYFLIAQILPILLGVMQSTAVLGIAPWATLWLTDLPISELLLVVLMSLALADRINTARNEVEQANQALAAGERQFANYLDALPFGIAVHDQSLATIYVNQLARDHYFPQPSTNAQRPYLEWRADYPAVIAGTAEPYPEASFPLVRSARGEQIHVEDLAIQRPEGQIPLEIWSVPLRDADGGTTAIITAFQDISQRRAVENELASYRSHLEQRVAERTAELATVNADLTRSVAELSAINQITAALSRSLDQGNVLSTIFDQLHQLVEYEGATVALVQEDQLALVDARGMTARYLGRRLPLTGGAASQRVLHSGRPLLIADTVCSGEWVKWDDDDPVRSWIGVPLRSAGGVIGVLSLASTQVNSFSPSQAELLAIFADQATVAVVNARLHQQAQLSAAAAERNRIARDLHDAVTQTIFSSSLIAAALPAHLGKVTDAAQADLDALQLLTRAALAEMRTLLLELRPENLVEARLEVLLPQLADAFAGRMGVRAHVSCSCDPQFHPPYPVKIAVYRIAQEALNNVAKHAGAAQVTINLTAHAHSLRLAVLDDGRGFDVRAVGSERMGLAIMRERAAEIGAELTIDSEPGMGTHIFLGWHDEIDQ